MSSPDVAEDPDLLRHAKRLRRAATVRKSVDKEILDHTLESLSSSAYVHGLSADTLETVIDALTIAPNHLDTSTANRALKVLVPRGKVGESVICKIVGCLGVGKGKPSTNIQAGLLKWLIMVYDLLEDPSTLGKLYGVLFNLLDMYSIRIPLAHLLALVTRRVHVKPYRIQRLLQLRRNLGNSPSLNALLQTYKSYYPDVIVGEVGPLKSSVFSHPDPEWIQKVFAIQEASAARAKQEQEKSSFRVARMANGYATKRRRVDLVVPEVHTFRAVETSVTLEDVRNVDDFVQKFDKLELPSQMAAALDDPLLQHLLLLRPSDAATERIDNWLSAVLADEARLARNGVASAAARLGRLLEKALGYTRFTRVLLRSLQRFLAAHLREWDGDENRDVVLGLLCYLPLRDFDDLHTSYFSPIERTLLDRDQKTQTQLLGLYTELLRNWTVTYHSARATHDEAAALTSFLQHVGDVCLSLLQTSQGATPILSSILSFYELASTLPWSNRLFRIVLPSDALVYHCVFANDPTMVSRICGVLSGYKKAFELCFKPGESEEYEKAYIDHFNGFLVDICNCLWRNRALSIDINKDPNAMGCTISRDVVAMLRNRAEASALQLSQLFSFAHSPAFARLSDMCFRLLEDNAGDKIAIRHAGPVTQRSLSLLGRNGGLNISQKEYRVEVLHYLRERGLVGIFEFMNRTMTSLIERSGKGAGARRSSVGAPR